MKGYDILFEKVKELVIDKYKETELINIENGFQFKIPKSPYMFKVMCYEQIGWNVFLEPLGDIALLEHPETDKLYRAIENIIDEINYSHYDLDENIKTMVDKNLNTLNIRLQAHSKHALRMDRKELKYIIELNNVENITPTIVIKYSIAMNKWVLEVENLFKDGNIYDEYFEMYNDISHLVEQFNREINSMDYYF
jgi:hypothetical protein